MWYIRKSRLLTYQLDLKPGLSLCAACCTLVARTPMNKPPLDPKVADLAPADPAVTTYDEEHIVTYLRLLDADAEGADWRDASRTPLHIGPDRAADPARRAFGRPLTPARVRTAETAPPPPPYR